MGQKGQVTSPSRPATFTSSAWRRCRSLESTTGSTTLSSCCQSISSLHSPHATAVRLSPAATPAAWLAHSSQQRWPALQPTICSSRQSSLQQMPHSCSSPASLAAATFTSSSFSLAAFSSSISSSSSRYFLSLRNSAGAAPWGVASSYLVLLVFLLLGWAVRNFTALL